MLIGEDDIKLLERLSWGVIVMIQTCLTSEAMRENSRPDQNVQYTHALNEVEDAVATIVNERMRDEAVERDLSHGESLHYEHH